MRRRSDDVVFDVDSLAATLSNTGKFSTSEHGKETSRQRRERRELSVDSYMQGKFDDRVLVPARRSAESFFVMSIASTLEAH